LNLYVLLIIFLFSFNCAAKICNKNGICWNPGERALSNPTCNPSGKCWDLHTLKNLNKNYCKLIGSKRNEIMALNESYARSHSFNLKESFDLINCYKRSKPLNISKTIIMRDMWPGHLTPHLCYASRSINIRDYNWVRDGLKKRPGWKKYLKTYKFALKNATNFRKFCNGVYPFDGGFRLKPRVLKSN